MFRIFKKKRIRNDAPQHSGLPEVAPDQLDHVIHSMRMSGALALLTEQQVTNIIYALQESGFRHHVKDVREAAYNDGHLISFHSADFLQDPLFQEAYRLGGEATQSWGGANMWWRVYTVCWAAAQAKLLDGDFVECGVNTGGLSRALMHYIDFAKLAGKTFYLLDTYCGIPEEDQHLAAEWCVRRYVECYEAACKTFQPFPNARLIRGRVPDALPQVKAEKVCYLSIDMNCAEPEVAAAEFFWDKLVPGAIVVLDDYGAGPWHLWQRQALDRFARDRGVQVFLLPTCQGLIIKP